MRGLGRGAKRLRRQTVLAPAPFNVSASPRVILRPRLDLEELERNGRLATLGRVNQSYSPFTASALAVHAKVVLTQSLTGRFARSMVTVNVCQPGTGALCALPCSFWP